MAYTDNSSAYINGRFNDVSLTLAYDQNSTTLKYNFAELGEAGSFSGATREESQKMFKDYLKKGKIIGEIMKAQALNSPTSPLTGVGGLFPTSIASDFDNNFGVENQLQGPASGSNSAGGNSAGGSIQYGSYDVKNGDRVKTISLPLSYTIRSKAEPRRQLIFSLPITQIQVGDAKSWHAGLGIAYRLPVNEQWTLTPAIRYSAIGSTDRATAASLISASLSSNYQFTVGRFNMAIGNMLGQYQTRELNVSDYSFDPDIKSIVMRNGIMLAQPLDIKNTAMSIEYSLIDTRYIGQDKPFLKDYQELGVTLGTKNMTGSAINNLRLGISYMRGKETKGFALNAGFWF